MTIDPGEASKALADIDAVIQKVKQSRVYGIAGAAMILWGAIVVAANVICAATPRWSGWIWLAMDALGVAATFVLLRRGLPERARFPARFLAAVLLFFVFGMMWSKPLGRFGPRELDAFWPTLFLFAQTLAGLWFGAAFSVLGLALTALILAGYFWSGEWFTLWLAVFNGGGLILCGLLMRRA
jgi:MFS family permease